MGKKCIIMFAAHRVHYTLAGVVVVAAISASADRRKPYSGYRNSDGASTADVKCMHNIEAYTFAYIVYFCLLKCVRARPALSTRIFSFDLFSFDFDFNFACMIKR